MSLRGYLRLIDRRDQNRDWDPLSQRGSDPFYPAVENIIWPQL